MKMKSMVITLSVLGLILMFGCASLQDLITPCYISPEVIKYADSNSTTLLPFTTLFDAKRIDRKIEFVHLKNQVTDKMQFSYLKGINSFHISAAEEFQSVLLSPTGPIGLLAPTLLGGSLGALLIKRPGDKSKKDLEKA